MQTIRLIRLNSSDAGTFGKILYSNGKAGPQTLELPWRDNERNISCIPPARYLCEWHLSPHWGWVYFVQGVPGRGEIRIHWGNYAGDVEKIIPDTKYNYKTDTEGCILLGDKQGELRSQKVIVSSRKTTIDFFSHMNREPFVLNIVEVQDGI